MGTLIMRLADADVLPFEFTATARTLRGYVDEIEKDTSGAKETQERALDFAPLRKAIDHLQQAANAYDKVAARAPSLDAAKRAQLNHLLYTSERTFKYDPGLPKREWFKHLIYAPGFYTGYGVKTLPGIREGIEQKAWDEPQKYIPIVAAAIDTLASHVNQAAVLIR
jgi:N-acetylated-alpha-linked acidic dipeptidase